MLLQDEQYIIRWLTQYGVLARTQVIRLLRDKSPQTAEKIIKNLKRQLLISDISGGYYLGLDPMDKPDQRIIIATWVLLQFADLVEPMAHYPASYPSQLFFLKYILVLPHIAMAKELKLPKAPCLFATVDYVGQDEPPVRYPYNVTIFRHVYDRERPERENRDHDNCETKAVLDIVALYVMYDDSPTRCKLYYSSAPGDVERTEVYVVPQDEFIDWLELENSIPNEGVKLYENKPEKL
jgi:hypothetical protein